MARKRFDRFGTELTGRADWHPGNYHVTSEPKIQLPNLPPEPAVSSESVLPTEAPEPHETPEATDALTADTLSAEHPVPRSPVPSPVARKRVVRRRRRSLPPLSVRSRTVAANLASFVKSMPIATLIWLGTLSVLGGLSVGAYVWLTKLPPLPECGKISPLASDMDRLYCAHEAAQSGEAPQLIAALELVETWSPDHPLYAEAQNLMQDWSKQLLAIANTRIEQNDLDDALAIAEQIPAESPLYEEAQSLMASWQQQWQQGEAIYATAEAALKNQNWDQASKQVSELGKLENEYWRRQRVDGLTNRILVERQAHQLLNQAQTLAKDRKPEQLGQAIALIQQVDAKTFVWSEAEALLNQWSQDLLSIGLQQWRQGNLAAAIAVVQQIPPDLKLTSDVQGLVEYGHAKRLADQSNAQIQPTLDQVWHLLEAMAAARQVEPDSPLYSQAQSSIQSWQEQLQDLTQLQFANVTAGLGQRASFQLAIKQAEQITADRPRRIQAQTLIASWHDEIERIDDMPYLLRAQALAEPGDIPDLRAAIAEASKIPLGRALRGDAQGLIARWNRQIETIEDQPLLDEAHTLAKQGKLNEAIRAAQRIKSGRALFAKAQQDIGNWRAEIRRVQVAEDRPILDEAAGLAARDRLTEAINLASQIGSGRALYSEAQAAIAQWRSEREAIWSEWEAEASQPDYSPDYSDEGSYDESDTDYEGYYDERYYENSY